MKLAELAFATGATIERGDPEAEITAAAGLDIAQTGEVSFLANPRYALQVRETRASAVFAAGTATIERTDIAVLRATDPYLAYTRALRLFHPEPPFTRFIHPSAVIDPNAQVADEVWIGAHVVISRRAVVAERVRIHPNTTIYEDVRLGRDTCIHSNVSIREGTLIGERVTIHNNVVVGSDGFGYAKDEEGRWLKIPQPGRVVIEDDVEIGAGTTIDRASVGETRIKRGAKLDNLVQIGHSCTVGEDALLCAQTGLAGSSHIGNRVILAGQVGIAGHLTVGDDAVLTAKSATSHDVPPGKTISGIPGFDNREWLRSIAAFRRLGEIAREVRRLDTRLSSLESDTPASADSDAVIE